MNEDIVCVSLKALWDFLWNEERDEYERQTYFCFTLRREDNPLDDDYYYDLYGSSYCGLRLCCDGEQCKIVNKTDSYIELIDIENIDNEELEGIDTTFKLSIAEFNAAVFS